MHAGSTDIAAAADALRSRLPAPLGALAPIAYNYRWSWTSGAPGPAGLDRSAPLGGLRRQPRPAAAGGPPGHARARSPATSRFLERLATLERSARGRAAGAAGRGAGHGRAARRLLLRRVRDPRLAARSTPAASACSPGTSSRRPRTAALPLVAVGLMYRQGYFRQRIDASGWQHEYWVGTDPDRVPAALVTGEDGRPVTVTVPIGDRRVVAQVWRVDVGRVPLLLLDADRPENDGRGPLDHLAGSTSATRRSAWRSTRCWGSAACGCCRRSASTRASCTSTRATPRSRASSSPAPRWPSDGSQRGRLRGRPPPHRVHHPHAGPGRQRHLRGRADRRRARRDGDRARRRPRGARAPRAHASRRGRRAVRRHPVRAALEPDAPTAVSARHGEVAREMWHDLWPDRAVDDVPITHVTNGVHVPTWIGGPVGSCSTATSATGWADRAAESGDLGGGRRRSPATSCGPRAARSAAALIELVRERSDHRAPRPRGHRRVRARGRGASTPTR